MTQQGCLVISDITGYTAYLSQAELDHAQGILSELFETLLTHTQPPLVISRLEGDAIICYAPAGSFLQGQTLVETIENTYVAFRQTRKRMRLNTTCTCTACSLIPELDLKFFVHHGEFIQQQLGPAVELLGSDVNLIHRLTKNHVTEELGLKAYALYTQAAVEVLGLDDFAAQMTPHKESYEHLGEVKTYVQDLHAVWQEAAEKQRIVVEPDEELLHIEREYPYTPTLIWDFVTKPEQRAVVYLARKQWLTDVEEGRVGAGATYHCAHGDVTITHLILDWQPFNYYTYDEYVPAFDSTTMYTIWLEPSGEGTHVTVRIGYPRGDDPQMVEQATHEYRQVISKGIEQSLQTLADLIAKELAAHNVITVQQTVIPETEVKKAVAASLPE